MEYSGIVRNLRKILARVAIDLVILTGISIAILATLSLLSEGSFIFLIREFFRPVWKCFAGTNPSVTDLLDIIIKAVPLWLTALAFSLPLKAGYFNIGGEGQLLISSFISIWTIDVSTKIGITSLSVVATQLLSISLAILSGILWALIPLYLKKLSKVNEVITSLVLNYLAAMSIVFLLNISDLASPTAQGIYSKQMPEVLRLDSIWSQGTSRATLLIPISLVILVAYDIWLLRTRGGLHLRAVGINRKASDLLGLKSDTIIWIVVVTAGACAAIAGLNDTIGDGRFSLDALKGLAFDGIVVAILGGFRAVGVILASIFFAMWRHSAIGLQMAQLPYETYLIAQAVFLLIYLLKERKKGA